MIYKENYAHPGEESPGPEPKGGRGMAEKRRVASVDCARALSMLYIIGIHHMQSFVRPGTVIDALANHAAPALCAFTAISALFIGRKRFEKPGDIISFYKSRLVRAYPLFLLGCLSLFVVSLAVGKYFSGVRQLLLTLTGLVMILGPTPKTMWYMSMLLLFWLLTPLFCWKRRRGAGDMLLRFIGLVLLLAAFRGAALLGARVDSRLYGYAAVYFGTLILADKLKVDDALRVASPVIAAAVIALLSLSPARGWLPAYPREVALGVAGAVLILTAGKLCARVRPLSTALAWISYGSMAAYLFHRQWLGLCYYLLGPFGLPLAALLMAVLMVGAYWVQCFYDRKVVPRLRF